MSDMAKLEDARFFLNENTEKLSPISQCIREGKCLEAVAVLAEGTFAMLDAFNENSGSIEIDYSYDSIKELCEEMIACMEKGNVEEVADIVEFEFKPLFEEWRGALDNFFDDKG